MPILALLVLLPAWPAPLPDVAEAALAALRAEADIPDDRTDLGGSWWVDPAESGFGSAVQRTRLGPGLYEVTLTLELHDAQGPWLWFEGQAVEAFGAHHLCMRWLRAEVVRVAERQRPQLEPMQSTLGTAALDAQACQRVLARSVDTLRLDNGAPYVERRPAPGQEGSLVPSPPWSLRFDDGSHNVTQVQKDGADQPIALVYRPMTAARSSSGAYDGGAPAARTLSAEDADALWTLAKQLQADPATHTDLRSMGTGQITWTTPEGQVQWTLTPEAASRFRDGLAPRTEPPGAP